MDFSKRGSQRWAFVGRLRPPKQLGGMIRWLFLLFATFNLVTAVPRILGSTHASPVPRAASVAAALLLGIWWLRGYRRRHLPGWAIPGEGLALLLIGVGLGDWVGTVGLLFAAVSFRGLFGGWRQVVAFTFTAFAGSMAAVAFTDPAHAGAFAQQAVGVPPLAIFTAAVALSTGRQERATARERVLSQVGTILATTSDRSVIAQMSADAGARLLAGAPGTWAAVTLIGEDGEDVAHASGAVPIGLETGRLDMPEMPAELSRAFRAGEPVYFSDGGYSTRGGQRLLVPLRTDKHLYGTLLAGGDKSVPAEVKVSVEGLAAQTTLGLVNAEYAADLRYQAFHDGLTGLANRTLLREHLGHALSRAERGSPVAVLLIDLDGFKHVNDTFGHAAGDHLLMVVAQRLRDAIRGADTAARLGGDEFAVLLDGMDAPGDALQVGGRLLAAIQAPLRVGDIDIQPCGSIGVAIWHGHATIDALLHDADTAMYAAKSAGKGRLAHLDDGGTVHVLPLPTELASPTPVS